LNLKDLLSAHTHPDFRLMGLKFLLISYPS